jgi:CO/xanthine dehydrogenase FAD-binding subunit
MLVSWDIPPEVTMSTLKEYDAKIDVKRRLTLRGARFNHYHVKEYDDGRIELEPRELVQPFELSKRTLATMDASMANLKSGKASDPIDLSAFKE